MHKRRDAVVMQYESIVVGVGDWFYWVVLNNGNCSCLGSQNDFVLSNSGCLEINTASRSEVLPILLDSLKHAHRSQNSYRGEAI